MRRGLNLVERWSAELTQKKLKRGVHRSVQALERDVRSWLAHWNEQPRPFVRKKTIDEILDKSPPTVTESLTQVTRRAGASR